MIEVLRFWLPYFFIVQITASSASSAERLQATCDRTLISKTSSPDQRWEASVVDTVCSDGIFVTTSTNNIQVVENGQPVGQDALIVEFHGHDEDRPVIEWLDNRELKINLPNKSIIGLWKEKVGPVAVLIEFYPNDSDERIKFLQELGLPPDRPQKN